MSATLTHKWLLAKEARIKRDQLEQLVARRTKALEASNQQLKTEIAQRQLLEGQLVRSKKMEAIGTLAAGVAHDLNNILSGIVSYPDLLMMKMNEDDPMYCPLSTIKTSGRKVSAIVQDMLTLARRNVAVKEPLDLCAVVRSFLDSPECRTILDYHPNVCIFPVFDSEVLPILGAAVHLEKMVMNLVSNAAEAMDKGGTIRIELCAIVLTEKLQGYNTVKKGDYVKLTVSDQGLGISENDVEHIFEPFFTKKTWGAVELGWG